MSWTFVSSLAVSSSLSTILLITGKQLNRAVMGRPQKFQGISEEVQRLLDADMDQVKARRQAREAFKDIQLSIDHYLFKLPCDGVKMQEAYEVNSRGVEIFTKSWVPDFCSPKAAVCFCHGYGDTCTFFFEGIARKFVSCGYSVFAMDYPGFGLSEGLHGYIPSFDLLVDDVIEHFSKIRDRPEICNLPKFLFGQSMGGAVALKIHLKQPDSWTGAILVAPMCKIADNITPPWLLAQILIGVASVFPKLKLVPNQDLAELAFRDSTKREMTVYNVVAYKHKPRLGTAVEMLRTTQEIELRLEEVSLPLLILHGDDDVVTDPSISKELYKKARSSDKTLNLYKDACHALLEGETDETIARVLEDIISWLDQHSIKKKNNTAS
ncbi:caffeoylshikimate esterase-like [Impatiens glandulifera]|uniref:caffeoylshikimate esterase-like n=1 Tax=Impatiens glandulifera TaxID=253017 RepID=UPI001FB1140B|nr:caffeoylshikimate esterase-like [Impatiens glandulifera]